MKTLKQAKYDLVLSNIKTLMLEQGISNLKISDIANTLEIGEATIYRYFGTKINLVIQVGVCLWQDIHEELSKKSKKETGYESIKDFFHFFYEGYSNRKEVFVFLDEFDSLMVKEQMEKEALDEYDQVILNIKDIYDGFYQQGILDESIDASVDRDQFYFTTTHMVLGICERLAGHGKILTSDELISDEKQIKLALDMCLHYIGKKRI